MQFKHISEETKEIIMLIALAAVFVVTVFVAITHLETIKNAFFIILNALAPFLFGVLMSFIMIPLRKLVENTWLANSKFEPRTKRKIAVAFTMVMFILAVVLFFSILIPQLADSLRVFIESLGGYIRTIQDMVAGIGVKNPELSEYLQKLISTAGTTLNSWLTGAQGGMSTILNYSVTFARGVMNFLIGMVISMYLLLDEERFKKQVKQILFGYLKEDTAEDVLHLLRLTKVTFNKFIFGKFIDSLIIGILCYVCCMIMRIPYSPLIAVVIGITNMIPVFGPFIGAIPCIFILLIISPLKSFEFMIFIFILQQIDGNIIGPHILGDAVGVPTLWVMFAIIVGGALFNVVGMFIGVPVFSVIYELVKERVTNNLRHKKIDVNRK